MKAFAFCAMTIFCLTGSVVPSASQSTQQICSEARQYLTENRIPAPEETLYVKKSSNLWVPLSQLGPNPVTRGGNIAVAYFFNRPYSAPAGAMSVKISVFHEPKVTTKAETIELYRPRIERGANRCEPRGKRAIENARLEINEYIDFHARTGSNTDIEDFHFRYPYGSDACARTERAGEVAGTFQFRDVKPTTGGSFIARNFGTLVGVAHALNHEFSNLRSELHYYNRRTAHSRASGFAFR